MLLRVICCGDATELIRYLSSLLSSIMSPIRMQIFSCDFSSWQLSFLPFGPACVRAWVLTAIVALLFTGVLRLDFGCQASPDKKPATSSSSLIVLQLRNVNKRAAEMRTDTQHTPSLLAAAPQRVPRRIPSNIFQHIIFFPSSSLILSGWVSSLQVRGDICAAAAAAAGSTCSLRALWIKPVWKSCISRISESCSGGFAMQRRALKINVALQGVPQKRPWKQVQFLWLAHDCNMFGGGGGGV